MKQPSAGEIQMYCHPTPSHDLLVECSDCGPLGTFTGDEAAIYCPRHLQTIHNVTVIHRHVA